LGQYAVFDKVYASHLMGLAKPDADFFTYILKAEGMKPEEVFFTDDLARNAEAAAGLGIASLAYTGADALRVWLCSLGISV
jgi:putative hydrolase of the HAD superfamily